MLEQSVAHYRILKKLGAGGMGEVYLAEDTRLDRKVALKLLLPEFIANEDRLWRFVLEAKAAAALSHPNIAHIYEVGEANGAHYIAMEFIDGDTLTTSAQRDKYSLGTLLKYLSQVAEGLAKAHAAAIVHRDLKPDNIMITRDGYAKILDFGLAKLIETRSSAITSEDAATAMMPAQPLSAAGAVMGTIGYMSPEQAQGKPVDQRSDIFSFGCILFEAVTGRRPFEGDSAIDTLHKIIYSAPAPVKDFNPDAPTDLQRVIRRCLEKDPEKRYQSIRDVGIELEDVRREIESDPQASNSVPPRDAPATSVPVSQTVSGQRNTATSDFRPSPPSSAEYIVTGIQRHKLAAVVALLVMVGAAVAAGLYFSARSRGAAIESIAVLPFENRSKDADTDYLSDGLAESLIYRLSQLPNLKVSPTSSVFRYKGKETDAQKIGNELGVNAVMTGRILQRGENLTISVELIDVRNNKLLWGEQYERKTSELLATQRDIAAEIAHKLQLKLSGDVEQRLEKSYTSSNEAYQLYLKGRFYWNKRDEENLRKAIEQFKAAADRDPNYALAFVGLADCYVVLPLYSSASSNEVLPQARAYAERALAIDDSLGEAHTSLGYVDRYLWNWAEAEKELKRGIELNPNYATAHKFYGNLLGDLGRIDEQVAEYKRAQELEPLSLIISINLAEVYLQAGDLKAAVGQCQRALDLDPNWYYARLQLSLGYLKQGRNAEAVAEAEKSVELSKRQSAPLGVLGYIYAQAGKRAEAMAVAEELKERYARRQANGYDLARVYVGLGDKDQAFTWLEKDYQSHAAALPSYLTFPPLDALRDDPRFKEMLKRMNLPE
ncbi:MAG: protein kinase domain-containing protein [Blastocatellia bacterium]